MKIAHLSNRVRISIIALTFSLIITTNVFAADACKGVFLPSGSKPLLHEAISSIMQQEGFLAQVNEGITRGGTCGAVCIANLLTAAEVAIHGNQKKDLPAEIFKEVTKEIKDRWNRDINEEGGMNIISSSIVIESLAAKRRLPHRLTYPDAEFIAAKIQRTLPHGLDGGWLWEMNREQRKILQEVFVLDSNEQLLIGLYDIKGGNGHAFLLHKYDAEDNWAYLVNPWNPNKVLKAKIIFREVDKVLRAQFLFDGIMDNESMGSNFFDNAIQITFFSADSKSK